VRASCHGVNRQRPPRYPRALDRFMMQVGPFRQAWRRVRRFPPGWHVSCLPQTFHPTMPNSWNDLLGLAEGGHDARLCAGVRERLAELLAKKPRPLAGEPYGRHLLHRDDRGEVMLAGWPANGRSAPHDHGDAAGFVLVLDGVFVETDYGFDGRELCVRGQRRFAAFEILHALPGVVHDMRAQGEGLTLHFYLPAIRAMRVYDREQRATFVVSGKSGAWLPRTAQPPDGHTFWDLPQRTA